MQTEVTLMMVIVGIIKTLFSKRSSNVLLNHFFDGKLKKNTMKLIFFITQSHQVYFRHYRDEENEVTVFSVSC